MEWLIHLANALFLASYAVRDILWLRVLTVLASLPLLVWFFAGGPTPQWTSIAWSVLFLAINGARVARLLAERRPIVLSRDANVVREALLPSLLPRQVAGLVDIARASNHEVGARIVRRGEPLPELFAIVEGDARVEIEGREVSTLGAGNLVGEMSFLTDATPQADVIATSALRCLAWDKTRLRAVLEEEPELRAALQRAIGKDLCMKLARR